MNSFIYRKGLFVIYNEKFIQIESIHIYDDEEYIGGIQWDYIEFDDFFNALQIEKSETREKVLIKFIDLKHKQLFEFKLIDHKYFIIADTLLVKQLI